MRVQYNNAGIDEHSDWMYYGEEDPDFLLFLYCEELLFITRPNTYRYYCFELQHDGTYLCQYLCPAVAERATAHPVNLKDYAERYVGGEYPGCQHYHIQLWHECWRHSPRS